MNGFIPNRHRYDHCRSINDGSIFAECFNTKSQQKLLIVLLFLPLPKSNISRRKHTQTKFQKIYNKTRNETYLQIYQDELPNFSLS